MAKKRARKGAVGVKTKAKKSAKATPANVTEDNLFQHLKLLHIRLLNAQASVSIKGGKTPDKAQIQSGAGIGIGSEQKNLHVNAILDVLGRPDLENAGGSQLQIHLEYQAVFQILDTSVEELLKFPKQLVSAGMLMIWPNFRETVMYLTGRMSIPSLVLPMFVSGATGVTLGGAEIKYIPTDGPPGPIVSQDSSARDSSAKDAQNRIQGYH